MIHETSTLSIAHAWFVGLGALLGSGALATGLGYVVQLAIVGLGLSV